MGVTTEGALDNWLANAPEHIIAGTVCAGLVALLLFIIVSTLRGRHRRAEIARLQRDVRDLSEDVTALQAGEVLNLLGIGGVHPLHANYNGLWRAQQRSTPWRRDYLLRSVRGKSCLP